MGSKCRVYFPKLKYPIKLSKHAELRMKQRAGLGTKKKRTDFMKKASRGVLTLSDIPRCEEFLPLTFYLRQVYKSVRKKNMFCMLYFYLKYIFVVSVEGTVVTFLKVEPEYESYYDSIMKCKESELLKEESSSVEKDLSSETSG